MRVVCSKAIQGRDKIKLEAHPPGFVDGPLKQVGLAVPDAVEGRQQIKTRIAVELSGEDVRLQVLVECLAQHLLVKSNAVEPRPDRRRPAINQGTDLLRELEERRQGPVQQLRRAHSSYRQSPRRRDDMRGDPAPQIDPLDLPEFIIRQNGGELQGLIEGRRKAGRFEIVECKGHGCSLTWEAEFVICQTQRVRDAETAGIPPLRSIYPSPFSISEIRDFSRADMITSVPALAASLWSSRSTASPCPIRALAVLT